MSGSEQDLGAHGPVPGGEERPRRGGVGRCDLGPPARRRPETSAGAAAARDLPRPRPRHAGSTSRLTSRRPASPRPSVRSPASSAVVQTRTSVRCRRARSTRGWSTSAGRRSSSTSPPRGATSTTSEQPGSAPTRSARPDINRAPSGAESGSPATCACTHDGSTSAATSCHAVPPTTTARAPEGAGSTVTLASAGGTCPSASRDSGPVRVAVRRGSRVRAAARGRRR